MKEDDMILKMFNPWYYVTTAFVGKWIVYVKNDDLKKYWDVIANAVRDGMLETNAKVTNLHFGSRHEGVKPIVVYTPDYRDKENIIKVREKLFELGFKFPIPYKRDIDTMNGIERMTYYDKGYDVVWEKAWRRKGKKGRNGAMGIESLRIGGCLDLELNLDLKYYEDIPQ